MTNQAQQSNNGVKQPLSGAPGLDPANLHHAAPASRLDGLDVARFLAFVGMVIVNFKIVMGATSTQGVLGVFAGALEGRAAATFVVLTGLGLGLAATRGLGQTMAVTLRRAVFLMALGLANMMIFEADILHYYAIYFVFGVLLRGAPDRILVLAMVGLNLGFVVLFFSLNYGAGWDWQALTYEGFWSPTGFIRNLFFNGWHPVIPWLAFMLYGIWLSRQRLERFEFKPVRIRKH